MKNRDRLTILLLGIVLGAFLITYIASCIGGRSAYDETEQQLEKEIGAFEITAKQRELAKDNEAGYPVLDAGRGNPNWINTKIRYAFSRFNDFSVSECERAMDTGDMAGNAKIEGISERFDEAMDPENEIDKFLIDAVAYCTESLNIPKDELLFEFANGIIGDYYPDPSRCLKYTEVILNQYLQSVLYNGTELTEQTELFATEGGSAAMSYIFHSLSHNNVLKPGDKIAIGTPIFTPYLQIPDVDDFDLISINVNAKENDDWDIPEEELKKLEDPEIEAFFLVNPSNPASHALSKNTLDRLTDVVKKHPDLIILTDDVYGTFVEGFESVYSRIPYNTILVYSFSKLYGVTGWRTGLIAMNKDNVVDRLISELPENDRKELSAEYSIVTNDPDSMKFIERVTADSRSIGLYHTSGLSTPSQIFMDFMALSHLAGGETDEYIELANDVVTERYFAMAEGLGIEPDHHRDNAEYYMLIDINELINDRYGAEFAEWRKENITDLDFLDDLAAKKGVVLMYGQGFEAPEGTVRVSLANLNKEDYTEIARRMIELLDEYHEQSGC